MKVNFKDADKFIVSPGCTTEVSGYLFQDRIKDSEVPKGYHKYEIMHTDSGSPAVIQNRVLVNFYGTFLTKGIVKMNKKGYHALCGRGGYTY